MRANNHPRVRAKAVIIVATLCVIALTGAGCAPRSTDPAGDPYVTDLGGGPTDGPKDVVVDSSGNAYASMAGGVVVKVSANGQVNKNFIHISGNGRIITSMTVDPVGNVYTTNLQLSGKVFTAGQISKTTQDGETTADYVSFPDGVLPRAIQSDRSGNLFTLNGDGTISRVSQTGVPLFEFARINKDAEDCGRRTMTIDFQGNLLTVAPCKESVYRISADGKVNQNFAKLTSGSRPSGIVADSQGQIYVLDSPASVTKFSETGHSLDSFVVLAPAKDDWDGFVDPIRLKAIAVDPDGNVYLADQSYTSVPMITSSGKLLPKFAIVNNCGRTESITVSPDGRYLYFTGNNRLCRLELATNSTK